MQRIKKGIKNNFVFGLILITPFIITVIVLGFVFDNIVGFIQPLISIFGLSEFVGGIDIIADIITILILFGIITLFGYIIKKGIGDKVFKIFEELMSKTPIVKMVYSSVREVSNTMIEGGEKYDRVILVDWPNTDSDMIGFVTGDAHRSIQEKYDEKVYNVFVPMSPNPTAGFLSIQKESNVEDVDISVEEGIKMILTTGMTSEKRDKTILESLEKN